MVRRSGPVAADHATAGERPLSYVVPTAGGERLVLAVRTRPDRSADLLDRLWRYRPVARRRDRPAVRHRAAADRARGAGAVAGRRPGASGWRRCGRSSPRRGGSVGLVAGGLDGRAASSLDAGRARGRVAGRRLAAGGPAARGRRSPIGCWACGASRFTRPAGGAEPASTTPAWPRPPRPGPGHRPAAGGDGRRASAPGRPSPPRSRPSGPSTSSRPLPYLQPLRPAGLDAAGDPERQGPACRPARAGAGRHRRSADGPWPGWSGCSPVPRCRSSRPLATAFYVLLPQLDRRAATAGAAAAPTGVAGVCRARLRPTYVFAAVAMLGLGPAVVPFCRRCGCRWRRRSSAASPRRAPARWPSASASCSGPGSSRPWRPPRSASTCGRLRGAPRPAGGVRGLDGHQGVGGFSLPDVSVVLLVVAVVLAASGLVVGRCRRCVARSCRRWWSRSARRRDR